MKKILLSIFTIAAMALSTFGQAPEGFKYQAVVRDAGNAILVNRAVGIQLTIQQGSAGGTAVYTETFAPTTNAYGLVNLEIGTGTTLDDFTNIDWANGSYFIETAIDATGGSNYSIMGTSQLMSVPYALYAKTSGNGVGPAGVNGLSTYDLAYSLDSTIGTAQQWLASLTGTDGLDGAPGSDGQDGPIGPQGSNGLSAYNLAFIADSTIGTELQWLASLNGATGAQGPAGNDGAVGAAGPAGANGQDGAVGAAGPAGANGQDGAVGAVGAVGATGPQGPAGNDGAVGAAGPAGANGQDGQDGQDGANGQDGAVGATGPQGPAGNDGAVGATGPAGAIGQDGAVGAAGPAGAVGAVGATGPQGPAGNDGATGPQGPAGAIGQDGAVGAAGPAGANGQDGAVGAIGPQGPAGQDGAVGAAGPQGPAGNDGAVGAIGPQGPAGQDGAVGAAGPQGPAGNDGAVGAIGPQGPAGANGQDGAVGAIGPQGPAGANGQDGAVGAIGPQGPAGANGQDGAVGAVGATGPQGPAGNDGAVGAAGANGQDGAVGATGPQGPIGNDGSDATNYWTESGGNVYRSSGNVGIGTTSPDKKLHIKGDGGDDAAIRIQSTNSSGAGFMYMQRNTDGKSYVLNGSNQALILGANNNTSQLYLKENGNVGIGTTAPATKLQVGNGTEQNVWIKTASLAGHYSGIKLTRGNGTWSNNSNNNFGLAVTDNGFSIGKYTDPGSNSTGRSDYLTINAGGNVGIGTSSPAEKLHVDGHTKIQDISIGYANEINSESNLYLQHRNSRNTIICSGGGNLGVDVNSPAFKLHVAGDVMADGGWLRTTGSGGWYNQTYGGGWHMTDNNWIRASGGKGLYVGGNINYSLNGKYFSEYTSGTISYNGNAPVSILASKGIVGDWIGAYSDERIKDIIGRSNSKDDLSDLLAVEVTDYKMKDKVQYGDKVTKKVIAQQLKTVFPQAVSLQTKVIPDIYEVSEIKEGYISLKTDLKKGDRVKLIFEEDEQTGDELVEVLSSDENGFNVDTKKEGKVFVYGKEIDDFHIVDYDAVSMLNVSATQELYKLILKQQKTIEKQKEQIDTQKAQISAQIEKSKKTQSNFDERLKNLEILFNISKLNE